MCSVTQSSSFRLLLPSGGGPGFFGFGLVGLPGVPPPVGGGGFEVCGGGWVVGPGFPMTGRGGGVITIVGGSSGPGSVDTLSPSPGEKVVPEPGEPEYGSAGCGSPGPPGSSEAPRDGL